MNKKTVAFAGGNRFRSINKPFVKYVRSCFYRDKKAYFNIKTFLFRHD
jgi:hypothetical protein